MAGTAEHHAPGAAMVAPAAARSGSWGARALALRPPVIAFALVAFTLLAHLAIWGPNAPLGRALWTGAAVEAFGLGWMLWAWWRFRVAGTPIRPTDRPRRFVDDGPFRFGRNPMYLGMVVSMLGLALELGAPTLVLAAAAFAAIVQRVHIPYEEARLREAFGGWYSDYTASVRRWL